MNFDRYAGMASAIGFLLILFITVWLGLWGPVAHDMTWTDFGEFIKVLGSIATGAAALTGAFIAWRGLEKWRSETTGTKRAELAATVLAEFYEMDEIIRSSRNPWVMMHEMAPIEGIPDDVASSSNFAPERRLAEHQAFFGRFRARKHEFAAVFGKTAAEPFDQMWKIRLDINHAVDFMLRHKGMEDSRDSANRKLWRYWHSEAFRNSDESKDPVIPRLQKAVASIEAICRPAIGAKAI